MCKEVKDVDLRGSLTTAATWNSRLRNIYRESQPKSSLNYWERDRTLATMQIPENEDQNYLGLVYIQLQTNPIPQTKQVLRKLETALRHSSAATLSYNSFCLSGKKSSFGISGFKRTYQFVWQKLLLSAAPFSLNRFLCALFIGTLYFPMLLKDHANLKKLNVCLSHQYPIYSGRSAPQAIMLYIYNNGLEPYV